MRLSQIRRTMTSAASRHSSTNSTPANPQDSSRSCSSRKSASPMPNARCRRKRRRRHSEDQRIATDKIAWALAKLGDMRRTDFKDEDSPHLPRLVCAGYGRRERQARGQANALPVPPGTASRRSTTRSIPGTYNARRDNLGGFWKDQFGHSHGIMVVNAFFENVSLHNDAATRTRPRREGTKRRPGIQAAPDDRTCWSRACGRTGRQGGRAGPASFAAITDEPPAEIAAAGHDRCIIPIKPENVDAWLNPDQATWPRCTRSSMIARGRTTSTDGGLSRLSLSENDSDRHDCGSAHIQDKRANVYKKTALGRDKRVFDRVFGPWTSRVSLISSTAIPDIRSARENSRRETRLVPNLDDFAAGASRDFLLFCACVPSRAFLSMKRLSAQNSGLQPLRELNARQR